MSQKLGQEREIADQKNEVSHTWNDMFDDVYNLVHRCILFLLSKFSGCNILHEFIFWHDIK